MHKRPDIRPETVHVWRFQLRDDFLQAAFPFLVYRNSVWKSVTDFGVVGVQEGFVVDSFCLATFRFNLPIAAPVRGKGVFVFIVFCILSFVFD
ncbi:Uncharacterised protein [Salmonella enterica subsp. enterica]|uniref:Uncharacterized protein n=1 Tax=Salmonella enterica I TaxID=59201 RepID=A0A3S4EYZ9_SALET|nr:Uncharacterised protein [Salmonella enterica subsp. enterica]